MMLLPDNTPSPRFLRKVRRRLGLGVDFKNETSSIWMGTDRGARSFYCKRSVKGP